MGYLGYIISLIWVVVQDTTGLSFNQGVDIFFNHAVVVNKILFWIVLGIVLIIGMAALILSKTVGLDWRLSGCWIAFLIFMPIGQGFIWWMSSGLANAFGPEGIIQPIKFWALVILSLLIGTG